MNARNPYQAPDAPVSPVALASGDCWRDDKTLIAYDQSVLPARCIKCGEPAQLPLLARRFYWHSPGYYALLLINLLIYAIVAAIVRKRVHITLGLCARHAQRRRVAILGGTLGGLLGLGLLFAGIAMDDAAAVVAGLVALIAAIVVLMVFARTLVLRRVRDGEARLHGCGPAFLASLPRSRPMR